jgi:2-polyprenyl-3-methyl-5-hydroxy-6-metoxy-1,4-benzoquinol methylase
MADLKTSREFWEEKATENAAWYISSYGSYHNRDMDGFWQSGDTIWDDLKRETGYMPDPTHIVVDIGCGIGRLTRAIAREVGHVHGFDISRNMLQEARKLALPNAAFYETEGNSLRPLPDKSCDLVLAYNVLQHMPNTDVLGQYLREMTRVSRGMIAFTLSPRDWKTYLLPLLRVRSWMRDGKGPSGIYKTEWTGIRPRKSAVGALSPVPLQFSLLHGDKWLFYGNVR